MPEQTANDVQGYVMNDPDVSGGFLVTGWSRTVMHQLADGNGSVVLERFEISSVSSGSRFLRIYVATGGSMPSVNMRIENHTQKWIHLTGNVSTTHHNYWQVQILDAGSAYRRGRRNPTQALGRNTHTNCVEPRSQLLEAGLMPIPTFTENDCLRQGPGDHGIPRLVRGLPLLL